MLSSQPRPAAQELELEHLQYHKGGHWIIPQTSVSPFHFLSHHFLSLQDLPSMVVLPVKASLFFFLFLLAVFHSERLSCDLLYIYIYSIRTFFIFLCFFNIHIFAIYLNRNIYVHTFENKHISYLFFYCESPDVTFCHCKTLEQLFLERSLLWD